MITQEKQNKYKSNKELINKYENIHIQNMTVYGEILDLLILLYQKKGDYQDIRKNFDDNLCKQNINRLNFFIIDLKKLKMVINEKSLLEIFNIHLYDYQEMIEILKCIINNGNIRVIKYIQKNIKIQSVLLKCLNDIPSPPKTI